MDMEAEHKPFTTKKEQKMDKNAKDAIREAEHILSQSEIFKDVFANVEFDNNNELKEPEDIADALQMLERLENKEGSLCTRFHKVLEPILAIIIASRKVYIETGSQEHKTVYDEMSKIGRLLIDHHEMHHALIMGLTKEIEK